MIRVRGLRKAYASRQVVDGLSFELAQGETFGLLGPNGAGKTTTIHLLCGLLRPDAGCIAVGHEEDPTRPAVRRCMGLAPQALALYEELTGAENLAFFGKLYGLSGAKLRARVAWALDFAGLSDRADQLLRTYSGGMQRRLNLACALVHEPAVVLLDEPTAGVDPQSRNHIFECIARLKQAHLTILYTTHYMEEAARVCDRVAILDQGRILALDTVDGLIAQHGGPAEVVAEFACAPKDLAKLPGKLEGLTLRFASTQPHVDAARLAQSGYALTSLQIRRPDLEHVFLALTGRRLRDE